MDIDHQDELSMDEEFLLRLEKTVLDNLANEQFSVGQLSQKVGISRSQLHRKLKRLTGKSISQYIRDIRLEEARKLLQMDVATSSEIGYRVGFSSTSYFNYCFHSYFGYPPGEVKKIKASRSETALYNVAQNKNESGIIESEKEEKRNRKRAFPYIKIIASVLIFSIVIIGFIIYLNPNQKIHSTQEKSIAILPFDNLSTLEENQFFADGIVEDLLNRLSLIENFRVISRTSSEMYRQRGSKSLSQIARELNVNYIIEGSVQRENNTARINVQLIDAEQDDHMWSKLYDRELNEIFKVQSEIALKIATELNTVLTAQQEIDIEKNPTTNVEAFEMYQLGRYHWNKRTKEGYLNAIEYFNKAISEDSSYALAYAGIADTYHLMAVQDHIAWTEGRDLAVSMANKALSIDFKLAEAHTVLASVYAYLDWNWLEAEEEFKLAFHFDPNYSTAAQYYSEFLTILGRKEESRQYINHAVEVDPLSFVIRHISARHYSDDGDFEKSIEELKICDEIIPNHPWTNNELFFNYVYIGDDKSALNCCRRLGSTYYHNFTPNQVDSIYSIEGIKGILQLRIDSTKANMLKARCYALLGESEKSLDCLERIMQREQGQAFPWILSVYGFKDLHDLPRFQRIRQKLGLTPG